MTGMLRELMYLLRLPVRANRPHLYVSSHSDRSWLTGARGVYSPLRNRLGRSNTRSPGSYGNAPISSIAFWRKGSGTRKWYGSEGDARSRFVRRN